MSDRDARFSEHLDTPQEQPSPSVAEVTPPIQQEEAIQVDPDAPIPKDASAGSAGKMLTRMHNKLGRLHLFNAFCENPINVTFQTQEEDEHVLLFLRKSQWVNAGWIITAGVLLTIPLLIYFLRSYFGTYLPPLNVTLVIIPFYYLLVAIYAFVNFITWYYNAALITNKRVVDIDFHQLVYKDVAETKLGLVQDVNYNQTGVLPNMLGYGFVLIQTAGTLENFEFHDLPKPSRVEEIVEGLIGGRRLYEP